MTSAPGAGGARGAGSASGAGRGALGEVTTISLPASLEAALRSGHPWIYRNHLGSLDLPHGAVVRAEAGSAAAHAVYDGEGAIALRLFGERPTPSVIRTRVVNALALRQRLPGEGHDAYRLVYGEGDYLPGIVCDRYGRFAIMKAYAGSVEQFLPQIAREVGSRLKLKGVALRSGRSDDTQVDPQAPDSRRPGASLTALWGELPPPELTVSENGLKFVADPWRGQKTGLFLDQRDNRQLVRRFSEGRRVLNLFAYNGGFSVYALAGGASAVVSVDIARPALEAAERNVAMNPSAGEHSALAADIFDALPRWAEQEQRYDMVVLDPPSLANNSAQRRRAQRAYMRLNRDALRLVQPGGLLVTSSCTAQVAPEQFKEAVAEAARAAGVHVQVLAEQGHALDHPVPLAFPEGRYLKFMLLRVL